MFYCIWYSFYSTCERITFKALHNIIAFYSIQLLYITIKIVGLIVLDIIIKKGL